MSNTKNSMSFPIWYDHLQQLAARHGESVADQAAWRESYEDGDNLNDAFYSEYPEHLDTPVT